MEQEEQTVCPANFKPEDFACKCGCGKGLAQMDKAFLNRLGMLRTSFGGPMVITSGFRCNNWNQKCKGEPKSFHLVGKAVDIACTESARRHRMVTCALSLGFSVGVDGAFVHVDSRDAIKVLWIYPLK